MPTPQEILDEISALLPDNTDQEISPADFRTILTHIAQNIGSGDYDSLDEWDNLTEYDIPAIVAYNNRIWKTKVDDNIGNQPPSDPQTTEDDYWIEQSKSSSNQVTEWAAGVYGSGLIVVMYGDTFYKLANTNRPFVSSNILTEILNEDWVEIGWPSSKFGVLHLKDTLGTQQYQAGKLAVNYDSGYFYVRKSSAEVLFKIKEGSGIQLLAKSKLKSIKITLSGAQVKALASTPITGLIAAPGANIYTKIISASARLKYSATPHDNLNHLTLRYDSHSGASDEVSYWSGATGSFLQASAEEVRELRNLGIDATKIAVNDSMGLYASGSDSTQNGGGLDLFVLLEEVDVS